VTAAPIQVIIDARTGKIDAMVPGVGAGDEVWFNSGDGNYYTGSATSPLRPTEVVAAPLTAQGAAVLGVIGARDQTLKQLVPTFNVPAVTTGPLPHATSTAHSVAANASNNHVFVALGANNVFPNCLTGCIAVYGAPTRMEETAEK
jgi:hypothetical protein